MDTTFIVHLTALESTRSVAAKSLKNGEHSPDGAQSFANRQSLPIAGKSLPALASGTEVPVNSSLVRSDSMSIRTESTELGGHLPAVPIGLARTGCRYPR